MKKSVIHNDGTVSFFSEISKKWHRRVDANDIENEEFRAMSDYDRKRINGMTEGADCKGCGESLLKKDENWISGECYCRGCM